MYFGNSLLNFKGKSFLYVAVPFFGFTAFLIIASAITGGMGYFGKICELKPISYFGKISYGVYLYHAFCLILIEYILHTYFTNINLPIIIIDVIGLVLTLAVSSISYYYLELPINSLKNKFKY
jgi:peptidoglycan/LPS O-acetylase OafA/YrhL